ncbi:MAG TPA: TMEM175 family protein [Acidimicrobiales bacterium]|nr:TMEM175 family protein [Acidimicrobiales bacterium]
MTQPDAAPEQTGRSPTRNKGRLEALSDGVFAVAITLLALDLAVPATLRSQQHLLDAIGDEWPAYLGYVVSFATIGAIWLGHNAITDYLERADVTLLRLNLLVLLFVSFLPFPTRLLAEYVSKDTAERVAATVYGLTLLASSGVLSLLWRYSLHAGLVRPDASDDEITVLTKRLSPSLVVYGLLIIIGLFEPVAAVIGYFMVALYLLIPVRPALRRRRMAKKAAAK